MDPNQTNTTPPVQVHNVPPAQPPAQEAPPATPPPPAPKKSGGMGPVVGIIIIIILLVFGGLYFWGAQLNKQAQLDEEAILNAPADTSIAPASDEPTRIESDLDEFDSADFEAQLQADLDAIEAEL